ncbi:hypothetical protein DYH09_09475 [bacterium CPR1]|nr:hypothetical protein [bacterium CPR1]
MQLLQTVTSYPTVIFSGLLGLLLVYWTVVLLGGLLGATDLDHNGIPDFLEHDLHAGGLLEDLGLAALPLAPVLTLVALLSWVVTCLVSLSVGPISVGWGTLVSLAVVLGVLWPAAWLARRMVPRREAPTATRRRSLVGKVGRVRSGCISGVLGTVELRDGGKILVEARLGEQYAEQELSSGSEVLLFDYDEGRGVFLAAPVKSRRKC